MIKTSTITIPALLVGSTLAGSYFNPQLKHFYLLSYQHKALYTTGVNDLLFVSFYVCVWLLVRQMVMQYVPCQFISKGNRNRFKEQVYAFLMYSFSFGFGMYCAWNSKWFNNYSHFFIKYPHRYVSGALKTYYLLNMSLWIHMIFVLFMEKKRSDHYQMLGHHVVTVALILTSWYLNLTRVGNCIFILFDSADILLSLAKCLNYAKLSKLCDGVFLMFVAVWAYTRHYVFLYVMYEAIHYLDYEPYKWNPSKGEFGNVYVHAALVGLLLILQVLALYWFWLIIKLLIKVAKGVHAKDSRSDDEDSDSKED
eukprot:NODE_11_length_54881_cov_1.430718.p21 type:complete len:310 gc:universal NODE_11_length_54881_cov_1.430718:41409-42338(+)